MIKRSVKFIVDRFWKPRVTHDWLEEEYNLMTQTGSQEIDLLIAKRERAKKNKKAWKPIQVQIEALRTEQLRSEV